MSLSVTIGGNEAVGHGLMTDTVHLKFNSADLILVDPSNIPALQDAIVFTGAFGTWTGKVKGIDTATFGKLGHQKRFFTLACTNAHTLAQGSGAFDLSDASPPANFAGLEIQRTRNNGVNETRGRVVVFTDGLWPGDEFTITCTSEGLSAETFTVMDMDLSFPKTDAHPRYELDIALGDFPTASTGAGDGGPLTPPTLGGYIQSNCGDCGGCCPPWDGVGTPASGQEVLGEFVAAGDDVTTTFTTAYPYTSGSLRVYFNTLNVTATKTEVDNTTGDFSVSTAPTTSPAQSVYVTYYAL